MCVCVFVCVCVRGANRCAVSGGVERVRSVEGACLTDRCVEVRVGCGGG